MNMILMMVLIFGVMWLFMIRPQQKQQKELAKFRESLERGSRVVTAGGIHGTVKEVKQSTIVIQIDSNVAIEVDKGMIMRAPAEGQK
ncbi:MAG: preprotein translocase subunit YajC [Alistipes sp.]|nr:preprotein translocase subunit YajC [Alistipes sp.]